MNDVAVLKHEPRALAGGHHTLDVLEGKSAFPRPTHLHRVAVDLEGPKPTWVFSHSGGDGAHSGGQQCAESPTGKQVAKHIVDSVKAWDLVVVLKQVRRAHARQRGPAEAPGEVGAPAPKPARQGSKTKADQARAL